MSIFSNNDEWKYSEFLNNKNYTFNKKEILNSLSKEEIDNAWIRVPWSHGGHYYHNTLTRDDQDEHPQCLSGSCRWKWD